MHEVSLCQSTLEIIEQQVKQHDVNKVTGVWLEIGALSCVEESAFRFCFDIACRGTVAQGCQLHIIYHPAQAWCWDCSAIVEVSEHQSTCPTCQSLNLKIEGGDSLRLKELEVE
ncbi:hydrogenase maturation nickel metallochaperone HypA [Providencia burhodogranariea]|uniref:Hydrogenase maturation factor HypA n=1 Tax=Providencia burhodogranariea DSM 19968 TaxID=1141662 RepID=K8WJL4_9GAMM|nr:hydrogenase maturation nickel metallochaperone HypA [Providencia burhodogranariea]EKT60793.1 hydrogenase nickel incorporation protein HybF [Providencia burhodogranariea DSM 19968]